MPGKGPGAVLLVHGLYGTPQQLQYIGRKLNVRGGYTVHIPNIEGYSVFNEAVPRYTTRWESWVEQLEARLELLRRTHEEVSLAGLCIGADLCMELAMRKPQDVSNLCLYSAPLRYDGWNVTRMRWLKYLGYYSPARWFWKLREKPPYGLKDERIRQWVERHFNAEGSSALGSTWSPLSGVYQSERLMKHVGKNLGRVVAPTLILHALEDDLASPANAEDIERGISSSVVRRVMLTNSYHIITMDFEKELVATETLDFIQGQSKQ
jgi:carboxylesterase